MLPRLSILALLFAFAACGDQAPVTTTPIEVVRVAPEVGAMAPGFSASDTSGRSVSLQDFRGRVVLLDFWATWCGPCIVDLPNMKRRWERYRGKDFEIIGISLDADRAAWRSFIRQESLGWVNIAEGRQWDSEIAYRYDVAGIPASFVVGRDGRVRAVNARGAALDSAIVKALRE